MPDRYRTSVVRLRLLAPGLSTRSPADRGTRLPQQSHPVAR